MLGYLKRSCRNIVIGNSEIMVFVGIEKVYVVYIYFIWWYNVLSDFTLACCLMILFNHLKKMRDWFNLIPFS